MDALDNYIFDFKMIKLEGGKADTTMNIIERADHLKSYGLEIIHSKFVLCKKCNFALHYSIGDTLVLVLYIINKIYRSITIKYMSAR